MRISNEGGREASARNAGRLALAAIPATLAIGALLWIAAAMDWIRFGRERRIDQRTLNAVGLSVEPNTPIVLKNHDNASCMKIESSFMDGGQAVMYARNTCQRWLTPKFSFRVVGPDGTVIESGYYIFSGDSQLGPGERREQRIYIKTDRRITGVELRLID